MTEEQVRAFFAHIEAVRARWFREVEPYSGNHLDQEWGRFLGLEIDEDNMLNFLELGYEWHEDFDVPLLAFVDFDAAAAPILARRRAEEEEHQRWLRWIEEHRGAPA